MAINVQKFLPQAKTSAIVRANVASSLANRESDSNRIVALSKRYNEENITLIKKPLLDIDVLIKTLLSNDQQSERNERLKNQRKQREEAETKLEAPKEKKKFNFPTISIPGTSFLDRIKRFLFFTALGFLFNTFEKELPRLKEIFITIGKVYNVAETIFKFILESIVSFIDRTYQFYDKVRETVKIIGGERAQKTFDELSSNLNTYINYVLIGGLALTGAIEAFAANVRSYKPPTPRPSPGAPGSGGRPRVTTSGGSPARGLDVRNPLRQRPTITTSGGEILSGAAKREAGKGFLRLIKGPLSRAPLIGGLIEFGISWALGDPVGKAAFRGVGSTLVGALGTVIGSFPPLIPFGGPAIGLVLGGWAGAELGAKLYEVLFENKKPSQPVQRQQSGGRVLNIKGYAAGGQVVGRGGRTIRVQKKTFANILPQTTQPGKDVGGEKEIQRLYPDSVEPKQGNPWITAILGRERLTITNPFRTLERTADTFKQIPFGIGALMGAAVDAALGQKISEGTLNSIATGLESLFENINSKNYNYYESMFGKKSEVPTMAVGGIVERTGGIVQEADFNPKKIIRPYIESTVGQVIEIVRRELSLGKEKPKEEEKPPTPPPSGGGPPPSGGGGVPGSSGGSLIATGLNDYKGRSIKLKGAAADAFIDMANEAKSQGIDLGPAISSSYRSLDDQIRVYKDKYGENWRQNMVWNSKHMEGTAFDINWDSRGGVWIRNNASRFGFVYNTYSGESTHFDWSGNYTPKSQIAAQQYKQTPPTTTKPSSNTNAGKPGPIPTGGTLSFKQLVDVAKQAGFTGENAIIAAAIAKSESGGRADNDTIKSGLYARNGETSYGLWQINMTGDLRQERMNDFGLSSVGDLYDPLTNARAAFKLSGGSNFTPWTDYKNGRYKQYLSEAKNLYKGGLLTPSPKDKASSLTKYPSYSVEGGGKTAVLPIIQEKIVPVPVPMGGNKLTSFRVSGGVNNNTNTGLMRG